MSTFGHEVLGGQCPHPNLQPHPHMHAPTTTALWPSDGKFEGIPDPSVFGNTHLLKPGVSGQKAHIQIG